MPRGRHCTLPLARCGLWQWRGRPEPLPRSAAGDAQAAAGGLPAVVTDVPGCREFVLEGVTGTIARADDVGSLAEAIRRLHAADVDAMGRAARGRVSDGYSIETVAATVVGVYRNLTGHQLHL